MAKGISLIYAAAVVALMGVSLWPNAHNGFGLLAVLISLPWGLGAVLLIDTVNQELIRSLGPPLVAMCGLLNAYLLYNALRPSGDDHVE